VKTKCLSHVVLNIILLNSDVAGGLSYVGVNSEYVGMKFQR
jgi:hypothetical protein